MALGKELRLWGSVIAVVLLAILGGCCVYIRSGTDVIKEVVSPDGYWDAVLMVRNGGAMTSYATVVAVVSAGNPAARQLALFWPTSIFVADANDGAVRLGHRGQLDVKVSWVSTTQLVVTYPEKAFVYRREPKFKSVDVQYIALE